MSADLIEFEPVGPAAVHGAGGLGIGRAGEGLTGHAFKTLLRRVGCAHVTGSASVVRTGREHEATRASRAPIGSANRAVLALVKAALPVIPLLGLVALRAVDMRARAGAHQSRQFRS